ncbi:MAG: fatty acid--CoA ligase family protein [Clostridiales bacterium]|nr:fatty acid--CoA ligase family protein [Clostridiales bacterium]
MSCIDFIIDDIKSFGEEIAIVTDGKEYTYKDLLSEYENAVAFLDENKVPDCSVVALRGEFSPKTIGMMLAIIGKNCIYVPVSTAVKEPVKYIEISEVQFYIDGLTVTKYDTMPKHQILTGLINENHPGLVLFSSGTTGDPKAAVHNLVPMLEKYKAKGKKIKSLAFLLFDHIGGFNTVMYNISNGGMLVTLKNRSPEEVASYIEKYKLELLPTSPSFLNMILYSHIYEKYDFSSLKIISYGTEPMPESTLKMMHQIFPDVKLKQTYGLSEVGIMRTKSESSDSLWLKVGGDEDHQIKIVDGILFIKSKMSMLGYLNAPSPFDEDGWMNTKDRVEQKGEYIKILGRVSELINVGGEKVYPAEVESVLLEVPGVKDAIVGKMPNPILGSVVTCKVAADEGHDLTELKKAIQKHCTERLEKFKRPVKIEFRESSFNTARFKRLR